MKNYRRTDLACEAGSSLEHIEGTSYIKEDMGICTFEQLDIETEEAAEALGKKRGRYITVSTDRVQYLSDGAISELASLIGGEIHSLLCRACGTEVLSADVSVLVVGLGNREITADAIGPLTAERLTVTRHVKAHDEGLFSALGLCTVSAFTPNVLGKTGIESAELIRAAAKAVKPHALIVIDALAARSGGRLSRTVQLSDAGIAPGAGVGNRRHELSRESLGLPVIAIGIPTVVDTATLLCDVLTDNGKRELTYELAAKLDKVEGLFVTPKDCDIIIDRASALLAMALEEAFVIS